VATRASSWLTRPFALRSLYQQLKLAIRLLRDPRVSIAIKAIPALAVLYILVPLDFVPDFLPALGQLDDVAILVFALEAFVRMCPGGVTSFHRDAIAAGRAYSPMQAHDNVINAEWRRE
jgi:uncharacterized membrane protein YkvA (DUF1232 family)